jgi:hypothetical protein
MPRVASAPDNQLAANMRIVAAKSLPKQRTNDPTLAFVYHAQNALQRRALVTPHYTGNRQSKMTNMLTHRILVIDSFVRDPRS